MSGSKQLQDGAGVQAPSLIPSCYTKLEESRLLLLAVLLWPVCECCSAGQVVWKNIRDIKRLVGAGCSKVHV